MTDNRQQSHGDSPDTAPAPPFTTQTTAVVTAHADHPDGQCDDADPAQGRTDEETGQ